MDLIGVNPSDYCANCDDKAVWWYQGRHSRIHLCENCKDAFEWGQSNPNASLQSLDDDSGIEKEE